MKKMFKTAVCTVLFAVMAANGVNPAEAGVLSGIAIGTTAKIVAPKVVAKVTVKAVAKAKIFLLKSIWTDDILTNQDLIITILEGTGIVF